MNYRKNKFLKSTIFTLSLGIILLLNSCATNPVTGEREFMLMTESEEISLGRDADGDVKGMYGVYDDPEVTQYVSEIGLRIAALSHRSHLDWHFAVLDSPVINAFALPGGYCYVTRGLLAHMNSEAELAMVIGHEIGHVTARHGARSYSRQILIMGGLLVGSLASEEFSKYAPFLAVGAQLLFLKYSRDQERQSDDLGVEYAYSAGYDPSKFDDFFVVLNRMKVESEGGGLSLPGFLSTHPVTANRITDVNKVVEQKLAESPPQGELIVKRDEYFNVIENLVFGDDPRQGYVKDGIFLHPLLGFSFGFPKGWALDNTPSQVQVNPESGDATIIFTISEASTPRDAYDKIVTDYSLNSIDSESTTVNGLEGFVGLCELSDDDGDYMIEIASVKKDENVYAFIGISEAKNFNKYKDPIESTIASFNRFDGKNTPEPQRVVIYTVPRQVSVEWLLNQHAKDEKMRQQLLLINNLRLEDTLDRGQKIKLLK